MRWPGRNLRLRSLMIGVALIAFSIQGYVWVKRMRDRAYEYGLVVDFNGREEKVLLGWIQDHGPAGKNDWNSGNIASHRTWAAYHGVMKRKYEYYASHPWRSPPPDPKQPDG